MASTQGFEPGQHWLEGSANPLLPIMGWDCPEADVGFLIGGGEKGLLYAFGVWSRSVSGIRNEVHSAQEPSPRFLIELSAKRDIFLIKRIFKKMVWLSTVICFFRQQTHQKKKDSKSLARYIKQFNSEFVAIQFLEITLLYCFSCCNSGWKKVRGLGSKQRVQYAGNAAGVSFRASNRWPINDAAASFATGKIEHATIITHHQHHP